MVACKALVGDQFANGSLAVGNTADDSPHFDDGVLQIGDGHQRGVVKRIGVNQFSHRALAAGNLAGNIFDVGDGAADVAAVLFDEINQRPHQIVDGVGGETFGEILDAGRGAIELGHDGIEVGLLLGGEHRAVDRPGRIRRPKIDGHKILPHQAGEFDDGLAVGFYDGIGVKFHRDFDLCRR